MLQIDGKTKIIGLLGSPVEHTLSPVIHNTLSELLGLNYRYLPFHVAVGDVDAAVKGAYALSIQGLNVTVPHKQTVMKSLVELDEAAKVIGAVNTLVRVEGGYKGYNTDMEGLRMAVREEGIVLANQTVVVLGAGGASKAVCYMAMSEGASKIYLLNRTVEKAEAIAADMNRHFNRGNVVLPMSMDAYGDISEAPLYVFQATSIGLHPNVEDAVITDAAFYEKVAVGFDLIYNPAKTKFMRLVEASGKKAYNGLKMLLYQGMLAYSYWTDIPFAELKSDAKTIYRALYQSVHHLENVVLIGFMGCGKSTVGKALAESLSYDFVDTDAYIVKKAGMTIPEIFSEKGEDYFRELETAVLRELMTSHKKTVFSTGGGMPLRKENAELLSMLGSVIYLKATPEETYKRIGKDANRPLLQCDNPFERIQSLLAERTPKYEAAADQTIHTDKKQVNDIVQEIIKNFIKKETHKN